MAYISLSLSSVVTHNSGESNEKVDGIKVDADRFPCRVEYLFGLGVVDDLLGVIKYVS